MKDLYNGATSTIKLHQNSEKIKLERGARQGDNISPKLFTACLQDAIIGKLDWEEKGIRVDGEYFAHLEFADDIAIAAHTPKEIENILNDIHHTSEPVGLKMHLGKTKVMLNQHTRKEAVTVNGQTIEEVEKYVYLGKTLTKDGNVMTEIKRRITLGWAAFSNFKDIINNRKTPMKIKRKIFNEFILPIMTYGCETWALTNRAKNSLSVAQRKMERMMLNITLRDRKENSWIRRQTGVIDIIASIKGSKHRWAGHIARINDNRWTKRMTDWTPRDWPRPRGRPALRWRDDLIQNIGHNWAQVAQDRKRWKESREGFLQGSEIALH